MWGLNKENERTEKENGPENGPGHCNGAGLSAIKQSIYFFAIVYSSHTQNLGKGYEQKTIK